ncbi:MAG TPA: O-antigen ligase family protein [Solirubrobacteraceae bacterium]|nr:O-antigen ligase family protein [Solirubrobacteraceae bacterium]
MLLYGALSGPLPKLGVVAAAALAAVVMLHRDTRVQAVAMLGALILCPVLLLGAIWHSPQLNVIHRHPLLAVVGAVFVLVAVVAAALVAGRWPALLAGAVLIALPFRIPIQAGGTTANLLVPLYFVVAAGAVAFIVQSLRPGWIRGPDAVQPAAPHPPGPDPPGPAPPGPDPPGPAPGAPAAVAARWLERLLAVYVVLYGLQAAYSPAFQTALQNMVFFYVPFALGYCLLRRVDWTRELTRNCLVLIAGLAVLFCLVGFVEYATKTIFLNPKLIAANADHVYFTVNSVFFDPNIFGRFLALVMILLGCVLLYARRQHTQLLTLLVLAILWGGLVTTLSRSSMGALLVGLGVLAALRWRVERTVFIAAGVVAVAAVLIVIFSTTFGLNQGLNGASSGRPGLVSGGLDLFRSRPIWGYGSGSFETEFAKHHHALGETTSASHTIPVTIAAEQGLIGELAYVAFVIAALITLVRRARADPVRVAIAGAFVALLFHTFLYADFLEDPITWTLLAIGAALARRAPAASATAEGDVLGRDRRLEQQLA